MSKRSPSRKSRSSSTKRWRRTRSVLRKNRFEANSRRGPLVFDAIRKWRERRVLRTFAIPDDLWREAIGAQPFLAIYSKDEIARLREKVVLFLSAKGIFGVRGHEVTPFQRTVIAAQACVLVLNLDLELYDDFENVIVYPAEFVAVLSEVFFADPALLCGEYPSVYQLMCMFYRQDPVSRVDFVVRR